MRFFRRKNSDKRSFLETTLAHQLREQARESARRARRQAILIAPLIIGVLVIFSYRDKLFGPSLDTPVRIVTVIVLVILGWAFARELGRAINPDLFKRMDPNTAGTIGFLVRLAAIGIALIVALRVAGLHPTTLAAGGAFTAVIVGLAAQQTLGNFIAGTVLLSARPFHVGERVRLEGAGITREGEVSSLGLLWTTLSAGKDSVLVPNSIVLNMAIVPLREPDAVDLRARLQPGVKPSDVQELLDAAITIATRQRPHIVLEEVDGDEITVRIVATPVHEEEGPRLADEILGAIEQVTPSNGANKRRILQQIDVPPPADPSSD
jgi:small conductance mechanosensitive channel